MSKREIPIVIIAGYLGAGKTTLMQNILKQEDRRVAVIVNDMGSINIDASLLNKTGNQLFQVEMVEMQNGCICCTLKDEFIAEIERLSADKKLEAIFVEASGISEPSAIAAAFENYVESNPDTRVYLKTVVSVADADRIYREFLHNLMSEEEREDEDIINLVIDQIEFCNLIILNKTDLLTEDQIEEVMVGLRSVQREAEIIKSVQGNVNLDVILNREDFDYDKVESFSSVQRALNKHANGDKKSFTDEYGITSFVYESKRPFNRAKFDKLIDEYPLELIRSKGYIWFDDDWENIQLFEQAGRNVSVTEVSEWISSWTQEELDLLVENFPDVMDDWDEKYGDRYNQIVLIGKNYNQEKITALLDDCLSE